ncbi:TPA: hypothetical protein N0F65_008662 [Lagenidium giganteum]|uniref:Uncharacterized protein n=1 Tax=Lagenidium giganteum TaxID=4803 RepID=A0AAV2ZB57_9STRA|nr:TPA: hypothetical protein N0F65_008662 [Lagenidium giganteum]
MEAANLPHASATKSLKHKQKKKRQSCGASAAMGDRERDRDLGELALKKKLHHQQHKHGASGEDLRDLLTSKIAELEVGGDELDVPIDLTGIFQDEQLAPRKLEHVQTLVNDGDQADADKVTALAAMLQQTSDELVQLQKKIGEVHAKNILLKQQKNSLGSELSKVSVAKGKLEHLCRELQKQNKLIISESRRIADDEDKKRKELSAQFQKTIEEVSAKMDQQGKDYVASLKENEQLQQKLKSFLEQYASREEHFKHQLQAKDLTVQLAEAKLQHQIELTARESEKVKATLEKAKLFSDRELQLQSQLSSYSEKFDVVQETLAKSNQMFVTFRDEMDKMAKHTKKLEKDNAALKKKCAEYDQGAIAVLHEKVAIEEDKQKLLDKIKKLEGLCRVLQADRDNLRNATKTAASEKPGTDTLATSPQAPRALGKKKAIGSIDTPLNYSQEERVFCAQDTRPDKLAAKAEVVESLRSRLLSGERQPWNMATSNYDNMQLTGKCYKRTNVNAERNRANMYVYNFRAEKLPKKYPTLKPHSNRFNMGIIEVALKDEYVGETFGDERMARGYAKRTEELPNHPDLRDKTPWNQSVDMTVAERRTQLTQMVEQAQHNSAKWKTKIDAVSYKSPEQLSAELSLERRRQKEAQEHTAQQQHARTQRKTMAAPTPPESLVLYGDPIFTGETVDPHKRAAGGGSDAPHAKADAIARIEDILNAILPPQMWREESGFWMRYSSVTPSTRFDVIKLQEEMDTKLMKRQARENGICPVREDVYMQCFDELIRQVTINCPERGLLLLRVRDEVRLTTDAYKTLYDSSITFGIRKQLQAEEGMGELQERIEALVKEKQENETKVMELTSKLELIEKRATERKALQDKKFKEEIDFLKYQGQHLDAFLKSAGGSSAASVSAAASK